MVRAREMAQQTAQYRARVTTSSCTRGLWPFFVLGTEPSWHYPLL